MRPAALFVALAGLASGAALAHPGGLARDGCHMERATGTRHCHGGGSAEAPPPPVNRRPQSAFGAPLPQASVVDTLNEREWVDLLRRLTPLDRAAVLRHARALANNP